MWERTCKSLFGETYWGNKDKEEENLSDWPVKRIYAIIRQHVQIHSVYPYYLIQLTENFSSLMRCMHSILQLTLAGRQTATQVIFDIVVLVTTRALCYSTIPYEPPGAAAAARRGTRAVLVSLVYMIFMPHRSGSKWWCDSTKLLLPRQVSYQSHWISLSFGMTFYHVHLFHLSVLPRWDIACLVMLHMETLPDVPLHLCYRLFCIQEDWFQWDQYCLCMIIQA